VTSPAYPPPVPPDLAARLRAVRLVVFDFDGVFTDNTVTVAQDGTESVTCWRGDGLGLRALDRLGVRYIVLSTETNPVVGLRCKKLRVPCHQGLDDKPAKLAEVVHDLGVPADRVLYVGNDVNDAGCLRAVGLPVVVADAHPAVVPLAKYRTAMVGGRGAVREVCDLIQAACDESDVGERE
jgi:3-deoxy-D-manno-octulosonate 8-phosphate phosphatase (KDO 8-P phosphatase)